jgi:pimeloyl-ACP methyl ester carboxylesterase
VLLHGFPQTWWQWHRVIPVLVAGGFRVVAPDYRDAGHSWRPPDGYDKQTMAEDIHQLLRQHLGIQGPVALAGHDTVLMIAYAYAQAYRDQVSRLVVVNAPLPGTTIFDRLQTDTASACRLPSHRTALARPTRQPQPSSSAAETSWAASSTNTNVEHDNRPASGTHGAGPYIGAPRCPRGGGGSFEGPAPPFGGQLSLRRLRFG